MKTHLFFELYFFKNKRAHVLEFFLHLFFNAHSLAANLFQVSREFLNVEVSIQQKLGGRLQENRVALRRI